jgi:hypothetical protein
MGKWILAYQRNDKKGRKSITETSGIDFENTLFMG